MAMRQCLPAAHYLVSLRPGLKFHIDRALNLFNSFYLDDPEETAEEAEAHRLEETGYRKWTTLYENGCAKPSFNWFDLSWE